MGTTILKLVIRLALACRIASFFLDLPYIVDIIHNSNEMVLDLGLDLFSTFSLIH